MVVKLAVQYKVGADQQQVQDAYYKLDDPEVQIQAYAFDVVRSHIPSMGLDFEAITPAVPMPAHPGPTAPPRWRPTAMRS